LFIRILTIYVWKYPGGGELTHTAMPGARLPGIVDSLLGKRRRPEDFDPAILLRGGVDAVEVDRSRSIRIDRLARAVVERLARARSMEGDQPGHVGEHHECVRDSARGECQAASRDPV